MGLRVLPKSFVCTKWEYKGDVCYTFCTYKSSVYGKSDLSNYVKSIGRIMKLCPEVRQIYASHNDFILPKEFLSDLYDALVAIETHKAEGIMLNENLHSYQDDPCKLVEYRFNGFSIVNKELEERNEH